MESVDAAPSLILEHKAGAPEKTVTEITLAEKLDRYSNHHRRALDMGRFLQNLYPDRAEKLRTCGAFLQFHDYYTEGEVRLIGAKFCQQDKLCPFCACRRAGKYLRKYVEKLQVVLAADRELVPFLVTITVKDGVDLAERVGHLLGSWRLLVERRRHFLKDGRRRPFTELVHAEGCVFSCEVKRGSGSGLWHPHMHGVWLCRGTGPDEGLLAQDWWMVTGDSWQVNVKPFDFVDGADAAGADWETIAGDFAEVFKYALKFGELELSDNLHAWKVLHGKRLLDSFGAFRGVVVERDLTDDLLAGDLPYIEVLVRFSARAMEYEITQERIIDFEERGNIERLRRSHALRMEVRRGLKGGAS